MCCGETRKEFLALDHVGNDGARERRRLRAEGISGSTYYKWLYEQSYESKLRILCHNCNLSLGFFSYCPHDPASPEISRISTWEIPYEAKFDAPKRVNTEWYHVESEVRSLLEECRDYNTVSEITGISLAALTTKNSRTWKIPITYWTDDKTCLLKKNFSYISDCNLAKMLDIPIKSVQSKARRLGLTKAPDYLKRLRDILSRNIASGPHRHVGRIKKQANSRTS